MRPGLTSLFVLAVASRAIAQDAWDEATRAYAGSERAHLKARAIRMLPPDDPRTVAFLVEDEKLLSKGDWWMRITAAERLATVAGAGLREKVRSYAKSPDASVREGIMAALSMGTDPLDVPAIVEGLKDPEWEVRRMACWAAGRRRAREAVAPMIAMLGDPDAAGAARGGERHPRVRGVLLYNLQEITGRTRLRDDPGAWHEHWARNREKPLPAVERFRVADFGGIRIEYDDTYAGEGKGPLVIALPDAGKTTAYYLPYLPQHACVRWLFVNLPALERFQDVARDERGNPIYPLGKLVDALHEMRRAYNGDVAAVLGHGLSCRIATAYAGKYPEATSVILLSPWASAETRARAIESAADRQDPDALVWAKDASAEQPARAPEEREIVSYVADTWQLARRNRGDLELGVLRTIWSDPGGTADLAPGLDMRPDGRSPNALIYLPGKDHELLLAGDQDALVRLYSRNVIVKGGDKFGCLPFLEAPDLFDLGLRTFVLGR